MAIEEGKNAPYFKLEDQDKNEVSLDDFKGKDIIIYFYPKDDTLYPVRTYETKVV